MIYIFTLLIALASVDVRAQEQAEEQVPEQTEEQVQEQVPEQVPETVQEQVPEKPKLRSKKKPKSPSNKAAKSSATKLEKKVVSRPLPPNQLQLRMGGVIWQENIEVRNGATQGNMETQSQGLVGSLAYLIPTGGRTWLQTYAVDLGFGAIKGKGRSAAIADELKGQLWITAGITPGMIYRTSPISAVALMLPFTYRVIDWKLKDGSSFNPEGDSSFSVGISGAYINQLSKNNYLYLSTTYQTNWAANVWNISWQRKFF
jgi:hypothetical protein